MEYINHVTLNTGNCRKTYANEIDRGIYFRLNRMIKESTVGDGVEVYRGYRLKTTMGDGGAIATIISINSGIPVITSACSKMDHEAWHVLHDRGDMTLKTDKDDPPEPPYIIDYLEVGAAMHLDAMIWTGDFARCFGWTILSPSSIR